MSKAKRGKVSELFTQLDLSIANKEDQKINAIVEQIIDIIPINGDEIN